MNIFALSDELFYLTFGYFTPSDLCNAAQVCRRFRKIANDNFLWQTFCNFAYPEAIFSPKEISLPLKEKFKRLISPYGRMIRDISLKEDPKIVQEIAIHFRSIQVLSWNLDENYHFEIILKKRATIKTAWWDPISLTLAKKIQGSLITNPISFTKGIKLRSFSFQVGKCPIKLILNHGVVCVLYS